MKTDMQLKEDVEAELKWEPSVHAAEIGVEVKDGIVTLAGNVSSYAQKLHAERATQRVSGVKALAVAMEVKLPGGAFRDDADIARTAENVLSWLSVLPNDAIKVMVEYGWITLTGELEWKYQQTAAVAAVRYLMGVKGVSDRIVINSKISSSSVKSDIEAALKRGAIADAQEIAVNVQGADITLSGNVHSWSERESAKHAAWGTPGVHTVVDNMTAAYY